jgi:hypothetical protein
LSRNYLHIVQYFFGVSQLRGQLFNKVSVIGGPLPRHPDGRPFNESGFASSSWILKPHFWAFFRWFPLYGRACCPPSPPFTIDSLSPQKCSGWHRWRSRKALLAKLLLRSAICAFIGLVLICICGQNERP